MSDGVEVVDPASGGLRLRRRTLEALGALGAGRVGGDEVDVRASALVAPDGALVDGLEPVAATLGHPVVTGAVWRIAPGRPRRAQLWWSPAALVVAPVPPSRSDVEDAVIDVVVQSPSSLARSLWRLWHLGPRPTPTVRADGVPLDDLAALGRGEPLAWTDPLGVEAAGTRVLRLDLAAGARSLCTEVVIDAPSHGCWRARGTDPVSLHPVAATELLGTLLGLQEHLGGVVGA